MARDLTSRLLGPIKRFVEASERASDFVRRSLRNQTKANANANRRADRKRYRKTRTRNRNPKPEANPSVGSSVNTAGDERLFAHKAMCFGGQEIGRLQNKIKPKLDRDIKGNFTTRLDSARMASQVSRSVGRLLARSLGRSVSRTRSEQLARLARSRFRRFY